jgi:hypothetical protein
VGADLAAIACPSTDECVAIDEAQTGSQVGHEVTFDPADPGAPTPGTLDTTPLVGLACPGVNQCVAIDSKGSEVSFNPESLSTTGLTKIPLTTGSTGLDAVSCSSVAQCTVIDANGDFYTFDPGTLESAPAAKGQVSSETLPPIVGLSCPSALTCVALEGTVDGATEIDFNPNTSTGIITKTLETINEPLGISCLGSTPSTTQCVALDSSGGGASDLLTFNASTGPVSTRAITSANAIACVATSGVQCTVAGAGGVEQTSTPGGFGSYDVDPGTALTWVSCTVSSECTAVDALGHEYTFDPDPRYLGAPAGHLMSGSGGFSFVSCPAVDQCTGISGTTEITFDQQLPAPPSTQYFSTASITGFVCPLASECVAVGDNNAGVEQGVTDFNPSNASAASTTPIDNSLGEPSGLSCASLTQCTTVAGGDEYTFAPTDSAGRLTAITPQPITIGTESYTALSCPSTTQCTALADVTTTGGDAITFNPRSSGEVSPTQIDSGNSPTSISCPSTSFCVIADGAGKVLQGNPTDPSAFTSTQIPGAGPLESVDCASTTQCVAVDANGRMFYAGDGGTPPAVINKPKPKPKQRPPTISGASLSLGKHGAASLRLTLHEGANAPRLKAFTLAVSDGLHFKGSVKSVHASGKARLVRGKLEVKLSRTDSKVAVRIGSPPLHGPRHKRRFTIRVAVTNASGRTTTLTLKLR